jgi:pSer/pThr/pTyr-binding forkhead associated (FHA) protein
MEHASLVMVRPDGRRTKFPLTKPLMVVGRGHKCDLRVPLSNVSREHCQLEWREDGGWYVIDLGSSNGTYCNKDLITEHRLEDEDLITIGPVVFTISIGEEVPQDDPIYLKFDELEEEPIDEAAETVKVIRPPGSSDN